MWMWICRWPDAYLPLGCLLHSCVFLTFHLIIQGNLDTDPRSHFYTLLCFCHAIAVSRDTLHILYIQFKCWHIYSQYEYAPVGLCSYDSVIWDEAHKIWFISIPHMTITSPTGPGIIHMSITGLWWPNANIPFSIMVAIVVPTVFKDIKGSWFLCYNSTF